MSKNSPATDFNPGQSTAALKLEKSKAGKPSGDAVRLPVQVRNVEQLYDEVNKTTNGGVTIELLPGFYELTDTGGRLDLQPDMSLVGVIGDASAVTIDTQKLTAQTLAFGSSRGASIRVGLGSNAIEWLTIIGNPTAGAAIATELSDGSATTVSSPTTIRVANVTWSEPGTAHMSRGVDIRNVGTAMAGRIVDAVIDTCDFSQGQIGMRFGNFDGANNGEIHAVTKNNKCYENKMGCSLGNNRTDSAIVDVSSDTDSFFDNQAGCLIIGGIITPTNSLVSNRNTTAFVARNTTIENNGVDWGGMEFGGIVALGGEAPMKPNTTSFNSVLVRLEECTVRNNVVATDGLVHDFIAFGARNTQYTTPTEIAGTHNTVAIELYNNHPTPVVEPTISLPPEPPKPTNKITIATVKRRGDVQPDSTPA